MVMVHYLYKFLQWPFKVPSEPRVAFASSLRYLEYRANQPMTLKGTHLTSKGIPIILPICLWTCCKLSAANQPALITNAPCETKETLRVVSRCYFVQVLHLDFIKLLTRYWFGRKEKRKWEKKRETQWQKAFTRLKKKAYYDQFRGSNGTFANVLRHAQWHLSYTDVDFK